MGSWALDLALCQVLQRVRPVWVWLEMGVGVRRAGVGEDTG